MDDTMRAVYGWMVAKSDPDGFVNAACGNVAVDLAKPLRTVQGAMRRLGAAGKVELLGRGNGTNCPPRWVVVEKAQEED